VANSVSEEYTAFIFSGEVGLPQRSKWNVAEHLLCSNGVLLWVKQPAEVGDLLWNELAIWSPQTSHSTAMRRLISDVKHRQKNITSALYFQFVLVRAQNAYLPLTHLRTWSPISGRKNRIKSTYEVRNTVEIIVLPSCRIVNQSQFFISSLLNPHQ